MNKSILKKLLKQKGFSLIELTVGVSVLAIVSLGVTNLITNTHKVARDGSQQLERNTLKYFLLENFRNRNACENTFLTLNSGGGNIPAIRNPLNVIVLDDGINYGIEPRSTYSIEAMNIVPAADAISPRVLIGDPFSSVAGLPPDRQKARVYLKIDVKSGRIGSADQVEADKSLGGVASIRSEIRIPVTVVYNTAGGAITECFGNEQEFVRASCTSLGGEMENGFCRRMRVQSLTFDPYAAFFLGNVDIRESFGPVGHNAPTPELENNLFVEGSVGSGRRSIETLAQRGTLVAQNSILVEPAVPGNEEVPLAATALAPLAPGTLQTSSSVGIGRAPVISNTLAEDTSGSLVVNRSLMVGVNTAGGMTEAANIPAQEGQVLIGHSLTVNKLPADVLNFAGAAGLGDIAISGDLSIGDVFHPNSAGAIKGLRVQGSVGIGNNALPAVDYAYDTDGTLLVRNGIGVGRLSAADPIVPLVPAVAGIVQDPVPEDLVLEPTGDVSIRTAGHIDIPMVLVDSDLSGATDKTYAVNAGWVASTIGGSFDPASVANFLGVFGDIIKAAPEDEAFDGVCKGIWVKEAEDQGDGNLGFKQGDATGGGCRITTNYCNSDGSAGRKKCETVYSSVGGVKSKGDIVIPTANITAAKTMAGDSIQPVDLCIGADCIDAWSDLKVSHGALCTVAASCGAGTVAVGINIVVGSQTYISNAWGIGSGPTYVGKTTETVTDIAKTISVRCCPADISHLP